MANYWLRGCIPPSAGGSNHMQYTRAAFCVYYYFFKKILGWSVLDESADIESVVGIGSGSDGALSSSNQIFSSSGYSFSGADQDRMIAILDSGNPENSGVYRLGSNVDSDNQNFDFLSSDNPTSATGLAFWIFDVTNASGLGENYAVFNVAHPTSPYQIKLSMTGLATGNQVVTFEICPDNGTDGWDATGHDWYSGSPHHDRLLRIYCGYPALVWPNGPPRCLAYGSTDGETVIVCSWGDAGNQAKNMVCWGFIDPIETSPAHDATEKIVSFGGTNQGTGAQSDFRDGNAINGIDVGVWYSALRAPGLKTAYMVSLNYIRTLSNAVYDVFKNNDANEPDHRDGTNHGAMPIPVQVDVNSASGANPAWSILGFLNSDYIYYGHQVIGYGAYETFGASNEEFHAIDGVCFPWPELDTDW